MRIRRKEKRRGGADPPGGRPTSSGGMPGLTGTNPSYVPQEYSLSWAILGLRNGLVGGSQGTAKTFSADEASSERDVSRVIWFLGDENL